MSKVNKAIAEMPDVLLVTLCIEHILKGGSTQVGAWRNLVNELIVRVKRGQIVTEEANELIVLAESLLLCPE